MIAKATAQYVILLACLLFVYAEQRANLVDARVVFFILSGIVLVYLTYESLRMRALKPKSWMIEPPVLASIITFALGSALTNAIYFASDETLSAVGLSRDISEAMVSLMALVLLGALCMWLGYWSTVGKGVAANLRQNRTIRRAIRQEGAIRVPATTIIYLIGIVLRLVTINLGVYGYSADYDRLMETGSYREYLTLSDSICRLTLLVVALSYFSKPTTPSLVVLCLIMATELVFGVLSGFKSALVFPLLLLGIASYIATARIPQWLVPAIFVSIAAAYLIIEPFREIRNSDRMYRGRSAETIADAVILGATLGSREVNFSELTTAFLARSNNTYMASRGIEYADEGREDDDAPAFLGDILLAPVHAVVPRLLWEGKSSQSLGLWYYQTVLGVQGMTAVGMSPFTYLYLAGGTLAVAIGFFGVGVLQRIVTDLFLPMGAGAIIIFLGSLNYLVAVDSSFNTLLLNLIRYVPLLFVFQLIVYRK